MNSQFALSQPWRLFMNSRSVLSWPLRTLLFLLRPWLPALPVLALPIAPGPSLLHNPSSNNNNNLLHLYSAFLDTQSALHSKGAISSSTTNVQHPPGWCDGSHSAPERPLHTSLLVERRQSDEANQCMGMIRRPWWSEASGLVWPGCRGNTPTLFRRTSWDFLWPQRVRTSV